VLLEIAHLNVRYEKAVLINDLSLSVEAGELVSLVGPNGAGKSTTLRAISGLVAWEREIKRRSTGSEIALEGTVTFNGERIDQIPAHEIVRRGLVLCPERRRPFREITVLENLLAGAYLQKDRKKRSETLDKVYALFPLLQQRSRQIAGTLSGGEQQMLAIARILRTGAKLLLLDEISEGLAPVIVQSLARMIRLLREKGFTVLMVEQNFRFAAPLADRFYVMEGGRVIETFTSAQLASKMEMLHEFLGV